MKELTLEERKAIMLEIMSDIDAFCRRHDIPYTLYCGTLLGAVRHKGFIPWDDDLDIAMLREDFERFIHTYRSEKYGISYDPDSDERFVLCGFAKVCDNSTLVDNGWSEPCHGIYIDIFPLDAVPEDKKEREKYMCRLMRCNNRLYHCSKKDLWSKIKTGGHSRKWWWDKYEKILSENKYKGSPKVAHIMGCHNFHEIFDKTLFQSLKEIEFEGKNFFAPANSHEALSIMYGEDYMTPPPPEKRITHNEKAYQK